MDVNRVEKTNIVCEKMKTFLKNYCNTFKTNNDQNKYYCESIAKMATKICYETKK